MTWRGIFDDIYLWPLTCLVKSCTLLLVVWYMKLIGGIYMPVYVCECVYVYMRERRES